MKKFYFLLATLCLFISVNAQIINIPDANFKAKLLASNAMNQIAEDLEGMWFKIDANNNKEIEVSEALSVGRLSLNNSSISNMEGIQYFVNLTELNCNYNSLTSLNMSNNTALRRLDCTDNQLTSLELSNNPALYNLDCRMNRLTNLNVSSCVKLSNLFCFSNLLTSINVNSKLSGLYCSNNSLTSLDLSNNTALVSLYCSNNSLTSLDLTRNSELVRLYCNDNRLTSLELSNNSKIDILDCEDNFLTVLNIGKSVVNLNCAYNRLTSLNVSNNPALLYLSCKNNLLKSLFLKNGSNTSSLNFQFNPNLKFICADENEIATVKSLVSQYGLFNCNVNSYCSFTPGGTFYTIQGDNRLDSNSNGCDVGDPIYPNLKYNLTDGINSGSVISNTSGNYTIPIIAGTHIITPVLENSTYFTISPSSVNVSFPLQISPFTQNFCVIPNGVHSDVEVSVFPLIAARPGFDAKYKIVYKNKGNQVESGSVNLTFDDSKMDFVSASATPIQSTGLLTWDYTNLQPFETKTIDVVFNINSPMESPAVNGGDVLSYTTTITSGNSDEMPNDNSLTLNQTVVNSFDPNDINCLEGAKVSTSKIGDYVHYIIRFENTGSANATNIVVKDVVDAAKYDVNSIIPINGSHNFYTRINGNNVEFIFENINLPFTDATNDGYVAFKIKTKSTLVTGDTFSKNANIYFDYNFPIVTNTATTTIAALSNQDFEFKNYFTLYPNPVSDRLNIDTKDTIEVSSINIYNTLGQLVLVIPNAQNVKTVDVSSLTSGNYFIKINSDKGTSNTKFIKD